MKKRVRHETTDTLPCGESLRRLVLCLWDEWPGSRRKHNPAPSETWWNLNLQLIGSRWMSFIFPTLRGETKSRAEGMRAFRAREDLCKEGHRQGCSVQTQLSNLCAHMCVCVHTHTGCLLPPSPRGFMAFRGWSLNKSPAPSRSPESQYLSAHIISQIPEPSLKTKTHSAFFLLRCCFHPSIHPSIHWSVCSLLSQCQDLMAFLESVHATALRVAWRTPSSLFCQILYNGFWHEMFLTSGWVNELMSPLDFLTTQKYNCNDVCLPNFYKYCTSIIQKVLALKCL